MRIGMALAACLLTYCCVGASIAQDFRIETEVFRGESTEPISENLTLFSGNLILDFMLPTDRTRFPEQIVIFISDERKFVLLDTRRRIKTELLEGQVLQYLSTLQSSSLANAENNFLFHPEFKEEYDHSSGLLRLYNDQITYEVRGERPKEDSILHRYYEFIGQFARLNATDPKRMPPFARLKLNTALKKYGFIPGEVQLTLVPSLTEATDPIVIRTTHNVITELSAKDEKRIESAKRYWIDFKNVSLGEFRNFQKTALLPKAEEDG